MTRRWRWLLRAQCLPIVLIAVGTTPAAIAEASDFEGGGPPFTFVDGYRQGGRTFDQPPRRIEPNTLYAYSSSDQHALTLLDGYLSAESVLAASESASDDDAAASRLYWALDAFQLRQEPNAQPLIQWTGGFGEEEYILSFLETPKHPLMDVLHGASPPRSPHEISLTVEISPPGGSTASGTFEVAQPRTSMGIDLLDPELYAGTRLEEAFAEVGPEIDDLRSEGQPLEDLTLHAGALGGNRTQRSTIGNVTGLIATIEDEGPKTLEIAKASSFADSARLRAGAEAADFSRTPANDSCEQTRGLPPPDEHACPWLEHEEIQLPSPQNEPPGISGADSGNRDPDDSDSDGDDPDDSTDGDEPVAASTTASVVPSDSVQAVQDLFPDSGASQVAQGSGGDTGRATQQTPGALVPEASVQAGSVAPVSPGSDGGVPLALVLGGAGVLLIIGAVARRLRRSP